MSGYHTGAGENDVTLETIDVASIGYLNGTNQQFDYGTSFPWGMVMVLYDYEAGKFSPHSAGLSEGRNPLTRMYHIRVEWNFVAIDGGYGSAGFFFNETGLQYSEEAGFTGWLGKHHLFPPLLSLLGRVDLLNGERVVCDWWHGLPQLFWTYFYPPSVFPSTCAQVDLLPVAV